MRTFKDAEGREWIVRVDAPTIQDIRSAHNIDLADIGDGETWRRLAGDLVLQVDILHVVLREQSEKRNLSARDFAAGLVGDALGAGWEALLGAISDFFPPQRRLLWTAQCRLNQSLMEKAVTRARGRIEDPRLEEAVLETIDQDLERRLRQLTTQSSPATDSPASAGSPPGA